MRTKTSASGLNDKEPWVHSAIARRFAPKSYRTEKKPSEFFTIAKKYRDIGHTFEYFRETRGEISAGDDRRRKKGKVEGDMTGAATVEGSGGNVSRRRKERNAAALAKESIVKRSLYP